MDHALKSFKDFLQIYNNLSQTCFKRCIDNLNSRNLEDHEIKCVDDCSEKFVKLNHRFMSLYVDTQQIIVNRRVKELEEQEEKARMKAATEISSSDNIVVVADSVAAEQATEATDNGIPLIDK